MFIPYQVDVPMQRHPWANYLLIAITAAISIYGFTEPDDATINRMILRDWSLAGLFGHVFIHAGILHLAGNMLFLWVFGNAICSKVGNAVYVLIYVGLGLVAGAAHLMLDGGAALGASGARSRCGRRCR